MFNLNPRELKSAIGLSLPSRSLIIGIEYQIYIETLRFDCSINAARAFIVAREFIRRENQKCVPLSDEMPKKAFVSDGLERTALDRA